jgi:hypothetical protein
MSNNKNTSILNTLYQILSNYSLYLSIILLAVVFFHFYPVTFASLDEHDYLNNANLILHGQLRQTCSETALTQFPVSDYCISKFNLGTSLFYIPAVLTNPRAAFAITFAMFALGIVLIHLILKQLKIDPIFTYLYAFYPSFVFFSRTLFSETFSATLILLLVYLLLRFTATHSWRVGVLIGLVTGLAIYVRYTNIFTLVVMLVCFWTSELQLNWKNIWSFDMNLDKFWHYIGPIVVGLLPAMGLIMAVDIYLYGGFLRTGYYYAGEQMLNFSQAPLLLLQFGVALCLAYPGMLIVAFVTKMTQRNWILFPALTSIVFYLGYAHSLFEGRILDLVVGIRYLVPIIPLLLILYFKWLNKFSRLTWFRLSIVMIAIALGVNVWIMSSQHEDYLRSSAPVVGQQVLDKSEIRN